MDNAVALSAIGVLGTSIGLMVWVVKNVLGKVAPALEKHSQSADNLTATVKGLDVSIKSFDTYLRERNGRDNEVHKEQMETMREMVAGFKSFTAAAHSRQEGILSEIRAMKVKTQTVNEQTVRHQTIEKSNAHDTSV